MCTSIEDLIEDQYNRRTLLAREIVAAVEDELPEGRFGVDIAAELRDTLHEKVLGLLEGVTI